jgi:23S rRNA pseudouridine2605 synthase
MKERIQKVLANAGVASRRNVEEMIRQGRVAVNGKVTIDLPILIDPRKDKITVDEELVPLYGKESAIRIYILMNKPKHVYSTNVAQGEQTLAIDLLPADLPGRVYPVGRMDAESKGLLLLTNDGELTNQLTHPRYGVPKTYRATVDGYVTGQTMQAISKGLYVSDSKSGGSFKAGRSHVTTVKRTRELTVLEITMREGRNPQIRKMLARLGHKVRDLTRTRLGPLTLHGLSPGDFRTLTPRELRLLKKVGTEKPEAEKPGGVEE